MRSFFVTVVLAGCLFGAIPQSHAAAEGGTCYRFVREDIRHPPPPHCDEAAAQFSH